MAKTLQFRRGNTATVSAITAAEGEILVDTDKDTIVVGDGLLAGGYALARDDKATAAFNLANADSTRLSAAYVVANAAFAQANTGGGGGGASTSNGTNVLVGTEALANITSTVVESTAIGYQSLYKVTDGIDNTAIGWQALVGTTSGSYNSSVGSGSMSLNTTGYRNAALGHEALGYNTTGYQNVAIGYQAIGRVGTGNGNVGVGYQAFASGTGNSNVALGRYALQGFNGAARSYNVAIGEFAASTGPGDQNVAVGYFSLNAIYGGYANACLGYQSGKSNTTGYQNVGIGYQSLYTNTTGYNNVALGVMALYSANEGSNNIGIGHMAGNDAVSTITSGSNQIVMGNNNHTNAFIKVSWTVTSDLRDKNVIGPVTPGLSFINGLNPIAYQFKKSRTENDSVGPIRYGFGAQDVLALEGSNNVIINNEDADNLKFNESSLIPVLVNAIKELSTKYDTLNAAFEDYKNNHK